MASQKIFVYLIVRIRFFFMLVLTVFFKSQDLYKFIILKWFLLMVHRIIMQTNQQKFDPLKPIIIIMGCVSQNGCLGPRRRDKQVYADLVERIHEQAKLAAPNKENIYETIKTHVSKKGLIRKLLDNLLSHQAKINDCLTLNLRLSAQADLLQSKLAGLLIMNEVISQIYKHKSELQFSDNRTSSRSGESHIPFTSNDEQKLGADIRYDLAFLRMVYDLIQSRSAYPETISSIVHFCQGRKEKISCRPQIWRVLGLLLQKLQRSELPEETAIGYYLLLDLLKEGVNEEDSHEGDLLIFLRLWQKQTIKQPNNAGEQGIQFTYYKIIKLFVTRCMASWDTKILFRTLLKLYDEQRVIRILPLQKIVLNIVQESDLHTNILRGLFLYLLQYISTTSQKNTFRGQINEEFQLMRYPHMLQRSSKLKAYQTLRRWGQSQYINLDESVNFSSSALIASYTANMHGQREYVQEVVKELFKLTGLLSHKSNLIIINLILEEIRFNQTDQGVRRILINLVRQIMEARKILQGKLPQSFSCFVPLDINFSKESRIELIQLMGFIIRQIQQQQLLPDNDQNNQPANICQFFYSLYEGSVNISNSSGKAKNYQDSELLYRFQYSNAVLSFLKCFIDKYAYQYVLGFLSSLNNKICTGNLLKIELYFGMYVLYQGMHLLNSKFKLPDKMVTINFKITPSVKTLEVKSEIQELVTQIIGFNGQNRQKILKQNAVSINQLRQFTMVDQSQFKQMQVLFSLYFKPKRQTENNGDMSIENSRTAVSQFKRQSINNLMYDSAGQRSRHSDDQSFKQIVQRIMD